MYYNITLKIVLFNEWIMKKKDLMCEKMQVAIIGDVHYWTEYRIPGTYPNSINEIYF